MNSMNTKVNSTKTKVTFLCFLSALAFSSPVLAMPGPPFASPAQEGPSQTAAKRVIGAIKAINGNALTLAPDSGAEVSVTVDATTRMRRIAPGEKDLKNATTVQLQDLQVGDRILVGGKASDDGKSISASSIVVMKRSDVAAKQEQDRQDWQKNGTGGLVSTVDAASGTITISVTGSGGAATSKTIAVHTSKATIVRRYAPDSVKFDDAKTSSLAEVKPGDQLRARGERSADGAELTADEIVTGSFRNIAGIVNSVDASAGTLTVQDLLSKKPVQIKISSDSQLHQLPAEMAQRIAMRLKGSAADAKSGGYGGSGGSSAPAGAAPNAGAPATQTAGPPAGPTGSPVSTGSPAGSMGGGTRQGGAPDFNQMLSRMPAVTLADLHKGDAVLIVATEGSATTNSTAITLVSGVEPILRAAPTAGQAMMLAPWSLGGPSGDAASQ
jgi:co-chaperonin GroES (HSP10)